MEEEQDRHTVVHESISTFVAGNFYVYIACIM